MVYSTNSTSMFCLGFFFYLPLTVGFVISWERTNNNVQETLRLCFLVCLPQLFGKIICQKKREFSNQLVHTRMKLSGNEDFLSQHLPDNYQRCSLSRKRESQTVIFTTQNELGTNLGKENRCIFQFSWTHVSLSMFKFHPQIIWILKAALDTESWAISGIVKAEGI